MGGTQIEEPVESQVANPDSSAALIQRIDRFLVAVHGIPQLPHEHRSKNQIDELASMGDRLQRELMEHEEEARILLRRVAILEEGDGDTPLNDLVTFRDADARLRGPAGYLRGLASWLDDRPFSAIRQLEGAALECDPVLATDALTLLTMLHMEQQVQVIHREEEGIEEDDHKIDLRNTRAALKAVPSRKQDLEAAERGYVEVLERDEGNVAASYGVACIYDDRGDRGVATELFFSVLASTEDVQDERAALAYDRLRRQVSSLTSSKELSHFAEKLLAQAPAHEAARAEILPAIFGHELVDDEVATAIRTALAPHAKAFGNPETRPTGAPSRSLLAHRSARLEALLDLAAVRSVELADQRIETDGYEKVTEAPGFVTARVLHDLWQNRGNRILAGELSFPTAKQRLAEYVRTFDRSVWWLGEAVRSGNLMDASAPLNITDLVVVLEDMHSSVSEDPVTAEALSSLVGTDELRTRVHPILEVLFRRMKNLQFNWREMEPMHRRDEVIRAACMAEDTSEFARDELLIQVNERLVLAGDRAGQVYARLALTELYSEQRRYELAIEHADASVVLDPENAHTKYWQGLAYLRAGKRLVGLDALKEAAERFGHPAAFAAMAEDASRDEDPRFASMYYISAVELALKMTSKLAAWELDQASDWLRQAKGENDEITEIPFHADKTQKRKERAHRKKELDELNAKRMKEKEEREVQMRELSKRLSWAKSMAMGTKRFAPRFA